MTISIMDGDKDTGISGISSKSSFVKTDLNRLFNVSAISLGAVIWPCYSSCSESCFGS